MKVSGFRTQKETTLVRLPVWLMKTCRTITSRRLKIESRKLMVDFVKFAVCIQ